MEIIVAKYAFQSKIIYMLLSQYNQSTLEKVDYLF